MFPICRDAVASAESKDQTEELIYEAIQMHLDALKEDGLAIPQAVTESETILFS